MRTRKPPDPGQLAVGLGSIVIPAIIQCVLIEYGYDSTALGVVIGIASLAIGLAIIRRMEKAKSASLDSHGGDSG